MEILSAELVICEEDLLIGLAFCEGNPLATGRFPHKGPIMQIYNIFLVVTLNKLIWIIKFLVIWDAYMVLL